MDIGTQVPHSAVRYYVMGERALRHEDATAADLDAMCDIVKKGLLAGAVGFSTSRTIGHRSILGEPIPGTFAEKEELLAIGRAMKQAGRGVFQAVPAGALGDLAGPEQWTTVQEVELFAEIARSCGLNSTFTLVQPFSAPEEWRDCLEIVEAANKEGLTLTPQIATRPIGFVSSLKSYHMFMRRRTYLRLKELPYNEMLAQLKRPEVKAAILADDDIPPEQPNNMHRLMQKTAPTMFPIEIPINYEPDLDCNMASLAAAAGKEVPEFMYDYLTAGEGDQFAIVLGANFVGGDFSVIEEMIAHPNTTIGLSDAGAHVNLIFDAVGPTYQLTHWVRDRSRGNRLPIELIVNKQTHVNAELFGLNDRGSLEVGKRADINMFDLDRLSLGKLEVHHDLPAGGSRILQSAEGYLNTFVNGVKTRENDQDTGARPGRVIR